MRLERGSAIEDYQRWLKSYKRDLKYRDLSANSLLLYERVLDRFLNFIEHQAFVKKLTDIDRELFLDFIEYQEEQSRKGIFSKKTKQLYLGILKSFFLFITDHNDQLYTFESEFKIKLSAKRESKRIKYLTDDEVERLLDYLYRQIVNRGNHSDYLYALGIKLMLYGGLRVSEMLSLNLQSITLSDLLDKEGNHDIYEIALLDTKANQEQTALVRVEDIESELDYFKEHFPNAPYLFMARGKTTPIRRNNFYVGVRTIMQKAGIDKKGLHIFRHTCAMQLYRKSKDILVTKEKLRHSDIKTTMIYAKAEKSDVAEAMRG
jgi:integrase/recombinase XerD